MIIAPQYCPQPAVGDGASSSAINAVNLEDSHSGWEFGTKAAHAVVFPDPTTGAIMTPFVQTSTYVREYPGLRKGFAYARGKNPTRSQLEEALAALENASHGLCFSCEMGAFDAVIKRLRPGDKVICGDDLFGGSYRLFMLLWGWYLCLLTTALCMRNWPLSSRVQGPIPVLCMATRY
jgi:hypothetical protein